MTPIYLNHLLCFVNLDTYESIGASKFLNQQFACSEERTTFDQRTGMSWTGRYYYGHSTYFEFMTPTMTSWNPRDGLAFSIEKKGGAKNLACRLERDLNLQISLFKRTRRHLKKDIPWFWTVEVTRKNDAGFVSWVMEYEPDFLTQWRPDLSSKKFGVNTSNISRSAFLDRYRSAIDDDFSNQIFRDIISVNISLPSNEATLFENELKTFGYMVPSTNPSIDLETRTTNFEKTPAKGINSITYRGPDLDIVLDRILPPKDLSDKNNVNQPGGIYAFTMNTNPVTCTTTHQFGDNCYLVVNKKGKAVWYFNTKS